MPNTPAVPKLRVAILFGGRSTEHEVSIASATTVFHALDPERYSRLLVGIDHDRRWYATEEEQLLPEAVLSGRHATPVIPKLEGGLTLMRADGSAATSPIDVVFPIVHGRGGEDGEIQGLFDIAGVPYVGCGVLASALAMDKVATKRVAQAEGIPVVPCLDASRREVLENADAFLDRVEAEFGYPVFAKPVNTGSSVGVQRAETREELLRALKDAGRYDLRVLVEPCLDVRELECGVLGGHEPQASVVGEILPANDFYDYESKYVSEATEILIPAELEPAQAERVRELAVRAFRALGCWGMVRADFFARRSNGEILLNELNTLPGFTDVSLYPLAWAASGIPLPDLVSRLLELALERHRDRAQLEIRYRR